MKIAVVVAASVVASVMVFGCKDAQKTASDPKAGAPALAVSQNGTVVTGATGVRSLVMTGPEMPDSYTFLDTPDANLCIDAFYRKGITLLPNTVARTMDAYITHSNGIALSDVEPTMVPVMNVLHLRSSFSNVIFQLLNPVGLYCIVKNDARFSNVQIQRSCSAQIAFIEPMTTVQSNGFGCFPPFMEWFAPRGTTNAYNSSISEMPCIP